MMRKRIFTVIFYKTEYGMIKKEGVKEMMDNIAISNQQLIVQINPHGAELMSIRDNFGDSAEQVEYLLGNC